MKHSKHFLCLISFSLLFLAVNFCGAAESDCPVQLALKPFVESGEMPGFVTIIADKEKILLSDTVGYADITAKKPMTEDTLFWIASTSKPLAAAAVMILVDEGKVSLDDPISKYIPEFEHLKIAKKSEDGSVTLKTPDKMPTLRQVLCHTGGWPFLSPFHEKYGIDSLPQDKSDTIYAMLPLIYEPGTGYIYSNIGINTATSIVERVSGMPIAEFMKKRLFDPLEMPTTSYVPSEKQLETLAKSYTWNAEKKALEETRINFFNYPLSDGKIRFAEGGGGVFSTAPELLHFFQMLANDGVYKGKRILSESAVKEMCKKQTGQRPENYGLGLGVGENYFGHGGAYGNDACVIKNGDDALVIIYMVQVAGVPKQNEAKEAFNKAAQKATAK
ncbi:MAG: serine hydrolase domain-containing protein [Thermoguttaceae bacterium]